MNQVNQFECDEALLDRFLHNDLGTEQRNDLEHHLDSCDACARRLEDIAAERWTWREVTDCLPSDEFDSRSESDSLSMLGVATSNARDVDNQALLSREISGWLDPTDDPDMLGRFAGYEIVGIIGHGGMGIVLKGFESSLNRYVAIKVLAPRLATNGAARNRFSREAQAAAAVRHDNVIAVHRVDEWHGLPFLVMPYVAGISLQKRIDAEGPLGVEAILRIASQVASGLAAAHAQGLVHRDIKPGNILLDSGVERVTITDFGLARAIDDATITRTGIIAGTPQFMSPEQAQAKPLDHRSDLFSLGGLMYAMATGRPPFRSDNHREVLQKIADSPARPVREIESSIPSWLSEIINWLQEKSPDDRPQSASEVSELLSVWLAHLQQPEVVPEPKRTQAASSLDSPPPPARWRRRLVAVAAGLLAIMAGVILILETSKGTIRIESELDGVPIEVKKGDRVVESLTVSKDGASVRVVAGEYVVEIEGDIDGIMVRDGQVTMKRGDERVVTIVQQARDRAASSTDGDPLGDEPPPGPRKDGIPGVIPAWERWEIRFFTTGIQTYARQLDFFKIELGAVGGGSPEIDYAHNLAKSKPDRRSGKAEDEKRLYMTSPPGNATAEFDHQLIARAGITTQRRMVLQFYPEEIENLLARLETQAALKAGHTDPKEFLKTVFGVRSTRDRRRNMLIVKDQYFRPAPIVAPGTREGEPIPGMKMIAVRDLKHLLQEMGPMKWPLQVHGDADSYTVTLRTHRIMDQTRCCAVFSAKTGQFHVRDYTNVEPLHYGDPDELAEYYGPFDGDPLTVLGIDSEIIEKARQPAFSQFVQWSLRDMLEQENDRLAGIGVGLMHQILVEKETLSQFDWGSAGASQAERNLDFVMQMLDEYRVRLMGARIDLAGLERAVASLEQRFADHMPQLPDSHYSDLDPEVKELQAVRDPDTKKKALWGPTTDGLRLGIWIEQPVRLTTGNKVGPFVPIRVKNESNHDVRFHVSDFPGQLHLAVEDQNGLSVFTERADLTAAFEEPPKAWRLADRDELGLGIVELTFQPMRGDETMKKGTSNYTVRRLRTGPGEYRAYFVLPLNTVRNVRGKGEWHGELRSAAFTIVVVGKENAGEDEGHVGKPKSDPAK